MGRVDVVNYGRDSLTEPQIEHNESLIHTIGLEMEKTLVVLSCILAPGSRIESDIEDGILHNDKIIFQHGSKPRKAIR